MKKRCNFEPISITNIVLFSFLFGIVGAGKLENLSGNEILTEKPAWANPRIKEKNHEDKLINAFDCMDYTLPSTQISLKPPKQCEVNDGSAYESGKRKKAQILERVEFHASRLGWLPLSPDEAQDNSQMSLRVLMH